MDLAFLIRCSSTLDTLWLVFIFLAVISTASIPVMIWSANVLFPLNQNRVYHSVRRSNSKTFTDEDLGSKYSSKENFSNKRSTEVLDSRILRSNEWSDDEEMV